MVYTKTGDNGTTSLVGGTRVKKCAPRVESYGTVDELNSHIGLLAEMLRELASNVDMDSKERFMECHSQMKKVQNRLFIVQTLLATEDEGTYAKLPQLDVGDTEEIEHWIDCMDSQLPKLKSFVIPGGSTASAQAHVCRTVCRRAERKIVRLAEEEKVDEKIKKYINRTSDYLFIMSRYILLLQNKEENFWSAE